MLCKAKTLKGYTLGGSDGELGKVREFYFDDQLWMVRYLVADLGDWLTGRQVLISPYAMAAVIKEEKTIKINLTKKQIEESPALDSDKPVSRQFEEASSGFNGGPMYWGGTSTWGAYPFMVHEPEKWLESNRIDNTLDPYLRSTTDVTGHSIQAADGGIGQVEDFIIDEETWVIRYLLIDTQNWWSGKPALLSPRWIERVSWLESRVFINHPRKSVKLAPESTEESLLTHDLAANPHYHRQGSWDDESAGRSQRR